MKQCIYVGEPAALRFGGNFEDTIVDFKILTVCDVKERNFELFDLYIAETKICNFSVSRWTN